jgi:hypothetical protein
MPLTWKSNYYYDVVGNGFNSVAYPRSELWGCSLSNVHGFSVAVVDDVLISVHFSKISVDRAVGACFNNTSPLQKLAILQQEIIASCAVRQTRVSVQIGNLLMLWIIIISAQQLLRKFEIKFFVLAALLIGPCQHPGSLRIVILTWLVGLDPTKSHCYQNWARLWNNRSSGTSHWWVWRTENRDSRNVTQ